MVGDTPHTKQHTRVLQSAIGVEQSCTHRTHAGSQRLNHQGFEPVRLNHLNVVVEQTDQRARGLIHGFVVEG